MGLTWTGYPDDFSAQLYLNTGTSRVYNTYDGSSWSATTAFSSTQWAPRHVVHAGGMSNQLFANNLLPEQTTNLGSSWSDFWTSNLHADTRAVYLDSSRGYLWAATDGAGNNGAEYNLARWSWSINNAPTSPTNVPVTGTSGLPIWQPYYVVETPSGTSSVRLFMGSQDNNGLCSDDRGVNWTTSGASMFFGDEISMVISGNRAYAWGNSNTLRRSDDAGNLSASCSDVAWTSTTSTGLGAPPSVWSRHLLAIHPTDPDRVYAAGATVIYASSNAGASFTASAVLPSSARATSIYVDSGGTMYVGTENHGVFTSATGTSWSSTWGPTWTTSPRAIMAITSSTASGGTSFVATTSGLYRKVGAGSWSLVDGGSGYAINDVVVDPNCPQRVYAALGFVAAYSLHRGGIDMSDDNGSTWTNLTAGQTIHQAGIAGVHVDSTDSRYLYAAVYGQGAWVYDRGSTPTCP